MALFTKQDLLKYLLELLVVAFGVFLGIFASDWNANRKTKTEVDRTINYIVEEMESNAKNLDFAIQYHKKLGPMLDSVRENLSQDDYLSLYFKSQNFKLGSSFNWTGPGLVSLQSSVYESGKIAGILQELDIETVQLISNAYLWQTNYKMMVEKIMDKLFELDSNTKVVDVIGIVEMLATDILMNEERTKEHLLWTLEELKKQ